MCFYLGLYGCKISGTETSIYIYLNFDLISGPERGFQWTSLLLFLMWRHWTNLLLLSTFSLSLFKRFIEDQWPHLTWGTCCDAASLARERQPWRDKGRFEEVSDSAAWRLGHAHHSDSTGHVSPVLDEAVLVTGSVFLSVICWVPQAESCNWNHTASW